MDFVIQMLEKVPTLHEETGNESEEETETNLSKIINLLESLENKEDKLLTVCIINRCLDLILDKAIKSTDGKNLLEGVIDALKIMKEKDMLSDSNVSVLGAAVPRLKALQEKYLSPESRAHMEATVVMNFLINLDPQASAGVTMTATGESVTSRERANAEDHFNLLVVNANTPAREVVKMCECILRDILDSSLMTLVCEKVEWTAERAPEEFRRSTLVGFLGRLLIAAAVPGHSLPNHVAPALHGLAILSRTDLTLVESCLTGDCLSALGHFLNHGDEKCIRYASTIAARILCYSPTSEKLRNLQTRDMFPRLLYLTTDDGNLDKSLTSQVMRLYLSSTPLVDEKLQNELLFNMIMDRLSTDIETIASKRVPIHVEYLECLVEVLKSAANERDFNVIRRPLCKKLAEPLKRASFSLKNTNKRSVNEIQTILGL